MSLPGVDPEDLDVTVDEHLVTISGMREEEKEVDEKEYYSKEIRRGSFSRTLELPKKVDPSKSKADYAEGVLTVVMPVVAAEEKGGVRVKVAA
jgi:HSP20 family protein